MDAGDTHLGQLLAAAQSPDEATRRSAEAALSARASADTYFAVALVRFIIAHAGTRDPVAAGARLLASITLRHYIEAHWSMSDAHFEPPEVPEDAKAAVKTLLPPLLADAHPRVRACVALVIAVIAQYDWPERWEGLFPALLAHLRGREPAGVHGAMRALAEFAHEITAAQIPMAVTSLAPELFGIYLDPSHSERTRGRAVSTLSVLIATMSTAEFGDGTSKRNRDVVVSLLLPMLPAWVDAFAATLLAPLPTDGGAGAGLGIRKEVLNCLRELTSCFPTEMAPHLRDRLMAAVWASLSGCFELYIASVVRAEADEEDECDSDGEALGSEALIEATFHLLTTLCETRKVKSVLLVALPPLAARVVRFMQITAEQEGRWSSSIDAYLEEEEDDDNAFTQFSVRVEAMLLIEALHEAHPRATTAAIVDAATGAIDEGFRAREAGDSHWWRLHEASLFALDIVGGDLTEMVKKGTAPFEVGAFIQRLLSAYGNAVPPFLVSRVLLFAGSFADVFPPPLVSQFLEYTVGAIDGSQPPPIRVAALRAVRSFVVGVSPDVLGQFCERLISNAIELTRHSGVEVARLALETVTRVVKINPAVTVALLEPILVALVAFWGRAGKELFGAEAIKELVGQLASCPGCGGPLRARLLPAILDMLQAPAGSVPLELVATALHMLSKILGASETPMPQDVVSAVFPVLFTAISTFDAAATELWEHSMTCFRHMIRLAPAQLGASRLPDGTSWLAAIASVVTGALAPGQHDGAALFACPVVTRIARSAPADVCAAVLPPALAAILQRLATLSLVVPVQECVMVFAELIASRPRETVDFAASVPMPPDAEGSTGLEVLVRKWVANFDAFSGFRTKRTSAIGLAKLLLLGDARVHGIAIHEVAAMQTHAIMTRSRTSHAPKQVVSVPIANKICLLLAAELADAVEARGARDGESEPSEDDDEEDDGFEDADEDGAWEDDRRPHGRSPFAPAEDYAHLQSSEAPSLGMFDDDGGGDDDDDVVDDDLNADDPGASVPLRAFLEDFFRSFCAHDRPSFTAFVGGLPNEVRGHVLAAVGAQQ